VIAQASPNIAFLKYWGKRESTSDADRNIPLNPSLSMTLSKAATTASVELLDGSERRITLNGKPASDSDVAKVSAQIERTCAFLGRACAGFVVESSNNFPQGAGIASSASAFAALTVATLGEVLGRDGALEFLDTRNADASRLARRGSGSACRSVAGGYMKWENDAAHRLDVDWRLRDTILIFSRAHKAVPSSVGHLAAVTSPDFPARLRRIPARLAAMESALRRRDLGALGPLLEEDALEMHAITRTGTPSVDYLLPETRRFLEAAQALAGRDFYFTIDAGPNLHILSERDVTAELKAVLEKAGLAPEVWEDGYGEGPRLL
jgi:diphosphomevalonate decarboxylase